MARRPKSTGRGRKVAMVKETTRGEESSVEQGTGEGVSTGKQMTGTEQSDMKQVADKESTVKNSTAAGDEESTVKESAAAGDEESTVKREAEAQVTVEPATDAGEGVMKQVADDEVTVEPATGAEESVMEQVADDEVTVEPATGAGESVMEQVDDEVTVEEVTDTEQSSMDLAVGDEVDTGEQTADAEQEMTEQVTSNEELVEKSIEGEKTPRLQKTPVVEHNTELISTNENTIDQESGNAVSTVPHAELAATPDAGEESTTMGEEKDADLTTDGAAGSTNLPCAVGGENTCMNQANGYDANFIDDIPEYLTCGVCYLVLNNPVHLVQCGHRLCQLCFQNLEREASQMNIDLLCPHDKIKVNSNKVFGDKGMSRGIMDLKVKCSNYDLGCQWIGKLQHLEDHTENFCSFMDGQGMFAVFNQLQKKLEHFEKGIAEADKEISILKKHGEKGKYAADQISWLEKQGEKCKQSEERLSFLLEKQVVQGRQSEERISLLESQLKQCVKTEEKISALESQLELYKKAEEQISTLEKKIEQSKISCENGIVAMEKHVKQCKETKEQMYSREKQVERRIHALEKDVKQIKKTEFEERIYTLEKSVKESKIAETARKNNMVLLYERESKQIEQRISFLEKQVAQCKNAGEQVSALGKQVEVCRKSVEDVSFLTREVQQHKVSEERICSLEGQIKQIKQSQQQVSPKETEAEHGKEEVGQNSSQGIGQPKQAGKRPAEQLPLSGDKTDPKSTKLAKSDTESTPPHQDASQSFQQSIILKAFALNKQRVDKIDKDVKSLEEQVKTLNGEMIAHKGSVSQDIKPAVTVTKASTLTATSFSAAVDRGLLISKKDLVPHVKVKREPTSEQLPAIDYGQCATALCDYEATDADEITLRPGNTVTQIEQIDEDWWRGMGPNRKYGLFPASYVTLIN